MKSLFTNFFSTFVASFLGLQDSFSKLAFQATSMRFSRSQETQADVYALDLVQKISGSTAGAFDFFRRMHKKHGHLNKFRDKVFSSHPLSKERIDYLETICLQKFSKTSCI
jgi:Zn-dependent protease with chaperone function